MLGGPHLNGVLKNINFLQKSIETVEYRLI